MALRWTLSAASSRVKWIGRSSVDSTPTSSADSARRASPSQCRRGIRGRRRRLRSATCAEAALAVGERAAEQRLDVVDGERLELEHAAAADQRVVDGEKRVGRRGADEHDMPSSTSGSSASCWALLKRWISSMNSSVRVPSAGELVAGFVEHFAHLLHAAGHGVELAEAAAVSSASRRASVVLPVPGGP